MNFENTNRPVVHDRPVDALLAAYAARMLPPALDALVAGHLEMKPDNRAYVAALDSAFGVFLSELDPVPLTGRDRRLVNIFAARDGADRSALAPDAFAATEPTLPAALRRFVGRDLSQLSWLTVMSGIEQAIVAQGSFGEASFLRCRPGKRWRMHGHTGLEAILVLKGAFTDQHGRYDIGDISVADETSIHRPTVETDSELICYRVSEDKIQAQGPIGRMLEQIFGR